MDRRNFLKKTFAASILGVMPLEIGWYQQADSKKNRRTKSLRKIDLTAGGIVYGGGLFNSYARNRDSVDGAGIRFSGRRKSQTGFLAGRQTGISPSQYFC
jgi:hypothetical protein